MTRANIRKKPNTTKNAWLAKIFSFSFFKSQGKKKHTVQKRRALGKFQYSSLIAGILLALFVLMAALLSTYQWATSTEFFALSKILLTGEKHLSYGEVLAAGQIEHHANSFALNISAAQARLAQHPWIKSVALRRELPNTLIIDIEEKQPVYWAVRGHTLYYCDEFAQYIAPVTPNNFASLPVLDISDDLQEKIYQLPEIRRILQGNTIDIPAFALASIQINSARTVQCFLDQDNLMLQFSLDNYKKHLKQIKQVILNLQQRGELSRARSISAGDNRVWVKNAKYLRSQ